MAAPPQPQPLDYWRGFFNGARASIFDAIDAAIRVAAADHPDALRARRDAIAERLYTALIALPAAPEAPGHPATTGQPLHQQLLLPAEGAGSVPSLCSSHRADAVANNGGGGEAKRGKSCDDDVVAEALRVKAALSNAQDKSEAELLELLGRLGKLEFSVDAIRATEIGMAVKPLRKHGSKQIRQLVRSLIEGWKATVNEWVNNADPVVDHTPQSVDASCLDQEEGGLPSPPMDEAALFAAPCTSLQLSEFFDEMDDDGNIRADVKDGGQFDPGSQESVNKQSPRGQSYDPEQNWKLEQSAMKQSRPNEAFNWQTRQQSNSSAQVKASSAAFGPGRPQTSHTGPKSSDMKPKQQQDVSVAQRRPKPTMPKPPTQHDDDSVRTKLQLAKDAKLEATKRKLQEGYQEFSNAKKQRTIQMVDPQDLPKQGNRSLALNGKPRNNSNLRNPRLGIRR